MSRNYDNWERLVHATLDREKLRQLARCDSIETSSSFRSSISSLSSSSFNFNIEFPSPMDSSVNSSISTLSSSNSSNLELRDKPAAETAAAAATSRTLNREPSSLFSRFYSKKKKALPKGDRVVDTRVFKADMSSGYQAVEFQLSPSTLLKIQKGDITQWSINGFSDAIVNSTNEWMTAYDGVSEQVHRAAGPELQEACFKVPEVEPGIRCPTGEARITPGFQLPVSHVIHTVGPIYFSDRSPETSLRNAYRSSMCLAKENNIQYVGFVAISTGGYRYPYEEAATVAISTMKEFAGDLKEVHFILILDSIFRVWSNKAYQLLHK